MGISYEAVCGKPAAWVRTVNITEWKDGRPHGVVGSRPEYLCDEHGKWHQKMRHPIKKLHVLAVG